MGKRGHGNPAQPALGPQLSQPVQVSVQSAAAGPQTSSTAVPVSNPGHAVGSTARTDGQAAALDATKAWFPELLEQKFGEFMLQEYWQLRQEIRDRLTSTRTIMGGTVTAFGTILTASAALLSRDHISYVAMAALWIVPHAFLIPSIMMITSEQLSIVNIARYIRLHIELPFLETGHARTTNRELRMPAGWENYLLYVRRLAKKLVEYDKTKKRMANQKEDQDRWSEQQKVEKIQSEFLLSPQALADDDTRKAIQLASKRDELATQSITWVFRALATFSTIISVVFVIFAHLYQRQEIVNTYIKSDGMLWAVLVVFAIGAISCAVIVYLLTVRYGRCQKVSAYWDLPGLPRSRVEGFIAKCKDDHLDDLGRPKQAGDVT